MRRIIVITALAAAACAQQESVDRGSLEMQISADKVAGTFELGERMEFEAVIQDARAVFVTLRFHGMSLVGTMDLLGAIDVDGFAENGEDTQLTTTDRDFVLRFYEALQLESKKSDSEIMRGLHSLASIWTEYPDTLALARTEVRDAGRGDQSICWAKNNWFNTTHDGPGSWVGGCGSDWWGDSSTYHAYVSCHGDVGGPDGTAFWIGYWAAYEPNHDSNVEYAYGNCFANCGGGCQGSGSEFSEDCGNHDNCMRFGHGEVGGTSCQDEFTNTWDDEGWAPTCGC